MVKKLEINKKQEKWLKEHYDFYSFKRLYTEFCDEYGIKPTHDTFSMLLYDLGLKTTSKKQLNIEESNKNIQKLARIIYKNKLTDSDIFRAIKIAKLCRQDDVDYILNRKILSKSNLENIYDNYRYLLKNVEEDEDDIN